MPRAAFLSFNIKSLKKRWIKTNSNPTSNEPFHISKLPLELLALIFEIGIDPESIDLETLDRTPEYPLIISSVCRTWRHVALNISYLIWSTISIHPNRTLELPLLYLDRSGETLLNICIGAYLDEGRREEKPAGLRACYNLILPYSHRWQSLKIYNHHNHLPDNLDTLPRVCAPNLTDFHLFHTNYHSDGPFPIFFDDGHKVPMLVHLRLYGIFRFSSQVTPFLSVQTLHLSYCGQRLDSTAFCSIFKLFPSLRQLMMRESGPTGAVGFHSQIAILPNLVELEFVKSYSSLRPLILNVQMPLLRVVTLPVEEEPTWSYLWSSFTLFHIILPSVEMLSISGKLNHVSSLIPQVFPNVRDLFLSETSSDWLIYDATHDLGLAHRHARYWPSLERLTIRRWSKKSDAEYLISFIKGLLEWHGRTIQKVKLVVIYSYPPQIKGMEKSFKKMGVQLKIIYAFDPKDNL